MPNASPAASAAGTTAHPGCDCENECETSVSSAWAITPLASAASAGPAVGMEPVIVATPVPLCALAYRIAAWPGGSSDPEIIAANVSAMWCIAYSTTSAGSSRVAAPLIYVLSAFMTWPGACAHRRAAGRLGASITVRVLSSSRRVSPVSWEWWRMQSCPFPHNHAGRQADAGDQRIRADCNWSVGLRHHPFAGQVPQEETHIRERPGIRLSLHSSAGSHDVKHEWNAQCPNVSRPARSGEYYQAIEESIQVERRCPRHRIARFHEV